MKHPCTRCQGTGVEPEAVMTIEQAQAEAVKRWGNGSETTIKRSTGTRYVWSPRDLMGAGRTWEEAFADADRREGAAK